ncbi:MAG TPA: FAD-dependent oxidoreductase [Edaphobacter sp.]|uniref:dihydrolipoyl dehydrogenase family protein n=1 Tax=Edaphobacter sp. TaxID=1934404 RepID=UPI002C7EA860|nr:FAD-dependent oxidoreductase [Edaphobacter sp.]HUZ97626.1 FAD-dependent oxidoreductase [Edaphobacter sp.]
MSTETYDLAILGAGSVGLIAADFAVKLGARVIMIERDRIGGDCTWSGCVPSKSLVKVARVAHQLRTASTLGIQSQPPVVDMLQVREYLRSTIRQIYHGTTPEALRQKGMDILLGPASFVDPHTLMVGDQRISANKILIATGAEPLIPSLSGLSEVPYSTYRQIFENDHLPAAMVVIGGGPVGLEIAQAYQRLGTQVTIFAERLLPKEEPDASEIIARVFEREGLHLVPERALSVEQSGHRVAVHSVGQREECDLLLVAAGRRPTLDGLNLKAAGVKYSAQGIEVNDRLQTSTSTIYAAGDVLGGEQFSHLAGWQGFQAARNALLPGSNSGFSPVMPRITFTDPEVAQVGLTFSQALASNRNPVVSTWPITRIDRAVCDNDCDGLLKIIATTSGTILGATIVGHRAGEAIMEIVMAMQNNLKVSDLASIIHPYPTYNSGIQLLATEMAVEHSLTGLSGTLIRTASKMVR